MMETTFIDGLNNVLRAGYILSVAWINCTMYLIASFYRKTIDQSVPRTGFLAAIALSLAYVASLFFTVAVTPGQWNIFTTVQMSCIVGSAIASGWSAVTLLIIMKKRRK